MKLCMWHLARPRPRRWLTTLQKAAYSDSSATKTYIAKSPQTYSPIPVSQVCSTPANLSTNFRTGKFFFFCRIFYPWMVPTLDQPGRQTWRDARIPRPRRTLVSTPLPIHRPTPTYPHPKASAMAKKAPLSSSNTSKILKQLSRTNRPIHRSTAYSTSMYPFGSGTSSPNRVTDAVVSALRCTVSGWCSPPRCWPTVSSCPYKRKFEFLRFIKLWSGDRFRRDRKSLMSVVASVLHPCASLALFRMSNVSFKISLKFVDKPRVYVVPPFFIYIQHRFLIFWL